MVEMHLLRVNEDFKEDPIFALGVITTYDRFMETYTPEKDQVAIFEAICRAQEADPKNYRKEAERLKTFVASKSFDELMAWLTDSTESGGDDLQGQIHNIAQNEKFKYSRLFGIGLLASLEIADAEILKDEGRLKEALHTISEALKLPENKMMQDVEVYRANLEKMVQTQQAIADNIAADRKRREQAAVEKAEAEKKAKTAAAEGTSEEKSDKAGASDAAADTSSPS